MEIFLELEGAGISEANEGEFLKNPPLGRSIKGKEAREGELIL